MILCASSTQYRIPRVPVSCFVFLYILYLICLGELLYEDCYCSWVLSRQWGSTYYFYMTFLVYRDTKYTLTSIVYLSVYSSFGDYFISFYEFDFL